MGFAKEAKTMTAKTFPTPGTLGRQKKLGVSYRGKSRLDKGLAIYPYRLHGEQ
jgi:hypothetical protein